MVCLDGLRDPLPKQWPGRCIILSCVIPPHSTFMGDKSTCPLCQTVDFQAVILEFCVNKKFPLESEDYCFIQVYSKIGVKS